MWSGAAATGRASNIPPAPQCGAVMENEAQTRNARDLDQVRASRL